ncbi:hypothetical protein MKL42_04045 [Acinetobacter sp. AOR15_HL]|uniref:DUF3800 domain-containing protein n=1 Tax=unclassified Acinetobacter TaxID=196816 RepID=UPI0022EA4223|nr:MULTISPECIES: DUF3800 domain-containing protein [unclassified Acinetobacter]MDA3556691.1 hypothetical protein [Acinetobacter sp. AOR15_HL]MDA3573016.1 hypothetical protein [Acinetobacter sp. AOR14_HL]
MESNQSKNSKKERLVVLDAIQLRAGGILNIFGLPVYGADEEYIFYYDETNNIRKLHLTEYGANADLKNFVLGGIVYHANKTLGDTDSLIKSLVLQKSAKEIKFNQLATGEFLGVLNSQRIRTLLKWLIDNDIYIHYTNFNILYWSIVDIVDSLWSDPILKQYIAYQAEIKNELFRLCNIDLSGLLGILKKYNYPNIQRDLGYNFMTELADHFTLLSSQPMSDITELVITLLQYGANIKELDFLVDNEDDVLIDSFKDQYLRPIYMFPNSVHIFDEEDTIQKELEFYRIKYKERFVDYKFLKSVDSIEIQLSDAICGLLGSYFNFLEEHSMSELLKFKDVLNPRQIQTLDLLRELIEKSENISNGFCHRTAPWDSDAKNATFLFGITPPNRLT